LTLGILGGCGPNADPYIEVVQDRLALQKDLVRVLQSVKDEASMAKAGERLRPLGRRWAALESQMRELPPPQGPALERLEREFAPRLQEAQAAYEDEVRRILQLPGGPQFFASLPGLSAAGPGPARDSKPGAASSRLSAGGGGG
jgi:hypothetical protein